MFYEYKCESGHITEVQRPVNERNLPLNCSTCDAPAQPRVSAFNFPHSSKAWRGRNDVNLQADDQHTVNQKQISLAARDKSRLPAKVKNRLLNNAAKRLGV